VGGDLASRRFALVVTGGLTLMALPLSGVSENMLKLAALAVGICGTLLLMAGLVFLQKTHYAGIVLIVASGVFLALSGSGTRIGATALGVVFLFIIAANLWNRRCALNQMLGINSCA
jgi:hypothetical protein